jgi:hypothetical protein
MVFHILDLSINNQKRAKKKHTKLVLKCPQKSTINRNYFLSTLWAWKGLSEFAKNRLLAIIEYRSNG